MNSQKIIEQIFYCLCVFFLIFFLNPIFTFLFSKYLDQYTSKLISNFYLVIIFIAISFLLCSITINNCTKTIPNKRNTFFLLLITVFYTSHRFYINFFEFLPYDTNLKFLDIIYLIFLLNLGNYLKLTFPPKPFPKSKLYGDSALQKGEDNELGNGIEKFVEKISTIITENCFPTAYSIGINSQWGDGKTSSLNMLKNKLSDSKNSEDYILIDFNPWLSFNNKILINDFFKSITEQLSNDDLSKQITEYSNKLVNEEKLIYKIIGSVIPFFNNSESLETIFSKINESLTILNKKLIIFIDDVDRLDNEEVFQLLKLIRNTANFKNTFFIIAYDRDYVNNAILQVNSFPSNNYLNKIINIELSLPYYDKIILSKIFIEKVLKLIGEKHKEQISNAISSFSTLNIFLDGLDRKNSFGYWINNIRDIKKLADSIYINFNDLLEDIDFEDMLIVEILHIRFPNVYKMIYTKKDDILYESNGILYIKPHITSHEDRPNEITDFSKSFFNLHLDDLINKRALLSEDKEKVIELFRKLFLLKDNSGISFTNFSEKQVNSLSVNKARKFERYFAQIISRENLSENEWNHLIDATSEIERITLVNNFIDEGKEEDLIERLEKIKNFSNFKQLENILNTTFQMGNKDSKVFSGKININTTSLINKFQFPNKDTEKIIKENKNKLKELIQKNIENNNLFNLDFLTNLYDKGPYHEINQSKIIILSREEIHEQLKKYFIEFIRNGGITSEHFWSYYHGAKTINFEEIKMGNNTTKIDETIFFDKDIRDILIEEAKKPENIITFLKFFITQNRPDKNSYAINRKFIDIIFENIEGFEEFLDKLNKSKNLFLEQFEEFYKKCKDDNFKNYIPFEFPE